MRKISLQVTDTDDNSRLDRFIRTKLPELSRGMIFRALRRKDIRLNGVKVNRVCPVRSGDIITVYIEEAAGGSDQDGTLARLVVIYEDDHLLLVKKQPGLLVLADPGRPETSLTDLVKAYWRREKLEEATSGFPPYPCHRLDRNTGGLVIYAKTEPALAEMRERFTGREVRKFYECVVRGRPFPEQGELRHNLRKDVRAGKVYIYDTQQAGTVPVISRYRLRRSGTGNSLLDVELVTGKTHQIRAQLAHIGCPIIGDRKYGDWGINRVLSEKGQALWASQVCFEFTASGILSYLAGRCFGAPDDDWERRKTALLGEEG